jgi:hypothetical protein
MGGPAVNIKIDLRKTGLDDVERTAAAQDRDFPWAVLNTVLNLRVPE